MKKENYIRDYISKILHKTIFLVTGGLGFVITAILEILFPGQIIKWVFYIIIVAVCIIAASYQVYIEIIENNHLELQKQSVEIEGLLHEIQELNDKTPRIEIGIYDINSSDNNEVMLIISSLLEEPQYEELLNEKRKILLDKYEDEFKEYEIIGRIQSIFPKNETYTEDVEKYLLEYRDYLEKDYFSSIVKDRARKLFLYINNIGQYPINNLTIEIEIPVEFTLDDSKMEDIVKLIVEDQFTNTFPKEPSVFMDFGIRQTPYFPGIGIETPELESFHTIFDNTSGPEICKREKQTLAIYKIKKLVPKLPERELSPILLWLGNIDTSSSYIFNCTVFAEEIQIPITTSFTLGIEINS